MKKLSLMTKLSTLVIAVSLLPLAPQVAQASSSDQDMTGLSVSAKPSAADAKLRRATLSKLVSDELLAQKKEEEAKAADAKLRRATLSKLVNAPEIRRAKLAELAKKSDE
ncbi:hypothetical protein Bealeia1_00439 [Candidatus Bealeia paramacronuclearis]|uniref:Uncharacterized protein n=2 Tax=Candidatus Bealeia paramacronuclearis TaxID=1921001 RepID=A0ABZ2C1K9_9PROT|nr:hypothetical protein [Candidatus Bealeia paramacronuclearis]